jgi:hypothetical protein
MIQQTYASGILRMSTMKMTKATSRMAKGRSLRDTAVAVKYPPTAAA